MKGDKIVGYIHLLNGEPGRFIKGNIYFAGTGEYPPVMVTTLRQIRREQQRAKRWDKEHDIEGRFSYGYARIVTRAH